MTLAAATIHVLGAAEKTLAFAGPRINLNDPEVLQIYVAVLEHNSVRPEDVKAAMPAVFSQCEFFPTPAMLCKLAIIERDARETRVRLMAQEEARQIRALEAESHTRITPERMAQIKAEMEARGARILTGDGSEPGQRRGARQMPNLPDLDDRDQQAKIAEQIERAMRGEA